MPGDSVLAPPRHPLHDSIKEIYDARAAKYDFEPGSFHQQLAEDFLEWTAPMVAKPNKSPLKVLDLCCGTGMVSLAAANHFGPDTIVHGVDISSASLERARAKAREAGAANVEFIESSVTDLHSLPLEKGSYSLITCCSALLLLHHDLAVVLSYWAEYLKPGGVLIFDVPAPDTQLTSLLMSRALIQYGILTFDREWVTSEDSVRQLILRSGLKEQSVRLTHSYKHIEFHSDSSGQKWEDFARTPFSNVQNLNGKEREEVKNSYIQLMKGYSDDDGVIRDEVRLYVAIAKKPE